MNSDGDDGFNPNAFCMDPHHWVDPTERTLVCPRLTCRECKGTGLVEHRNGGEQVCPDCEVTDASR